MKKGQRVIYLGGEDTEKYLTVGKIYEITAVKGDQDWQGDIIKKDEVFQIINNHHESIYCLYPSCAFGDWELIDNVH